MCGRLNALLALLVALNASALAASAEDVSLMGLSRAEVEKVLGKPNSSLRRADGEILVFGDGVRVEMRDEQVVSVRGGAFGEIVVGDGTRYTVDAKGKATHANEPRFVAPAETPATPEPEVAPDVASTVSAPVASVEEPVVEEQAEAMDEDLALVHAAEHPEEALASSNPAVARLLEEHELALEEGVEAPAEESVWVQNVIELVLHLIVVLVILAATLKWMGLPFTIGDLVKIGVLTVAVREVLHGIGGLGGNWEMLRLFRVDEMVSFVALAIFLFRFKVVFTGLTALKVAAATKFVAYMLMIGVGLALTFGMLAVQ